MSNQHYNGMVSFTYKNEGYDAYVSAKASYSFTPGRRYMANGDPGYPDESNFEIDDIDVETVFKDEGNEVPYVDEMEADIAEALKNVDWEQDEYEPPEPDEDYEPPEYDEAYTKACLEEDIG